MSSKAGSGSGSAFDVCGSASLVPSVTIKYLRYLPTFCTLGVEYRHKEMMMMECSKHAKFMNRNEEKVVITQIYVFLFFRCFTKSVLNVNFDQTPPLPPYFICFHRNQFSFFFYTNF